MERVMHWVVGMMTCKSRVESGVTEKSLDSLELAGFPRSIVSVHVDGERKEAYGIVGNWILTAWEIYLRSPKAHMYAIFQDDIICSKGLREYLDKTLGVHKKAYFNLYTRGSNYNELKDQPNGWHESNQFGRGALGLVFSRAALTAVLSSQELVAKPQTSRGTVGIDGAILYGMARAGFSERVHVPSLIQHRDEDEVESTKGGPRGRVSPCFLGEDFNLMEQSCQTNESDLSDTLATADSENSIDKLLSSFPESSNG
jgi:hypothetical protein